MKKIINIIAFAAIAFLTSCDLDLYPETSYNEGNVKVEENTESQYSTRADMEGLRKTLYDNWMKDIQEKDYTDWLVYTECRADNAYAGSPTTGEIVDIESNKQDANNKNVKRDWDWYLGQVSNANQLICNIDSIAIKDPSLTPEERDRWKAEMLIWRSYILLKMTYLWGDVPMVTTIPPAITAENVEEVYPAYFPERKPIAEVYARIIEDLEFACKYAPDVNKDNKMLMSKAVAYGLLARVYAEKTARDWNKVAQACQAVEDMGFALVDDFGRMWAYDEDDAVRNTSESILEVTWTRSNGNWFWMMFHRNAYNPDDSFSWMKWITPSRDLIAAYDAEGDTERKNVNIVYDKCSWSNYYPSDRYPFMNKVPTNASSTILMRLGEIYLLHAEALAMTDKLSEAAGYVNRIRSRAGLANLPAAASSSKDAMIDAILKERRLELAFEGFRFFDLVRHDQAVRTCAAVAAADKYWAARSPLTEETILMPVSQEARDKNPSLKQNPGY